MTVHAVKRCSSLFRFGGVPCPARASRAAAKKNLHPAGSIFFAPPLPATALWRLEPPPARSIGRHPRLPLAPLTLFSGALRASFQRVPAAAFVIARRRVASLVAAGKAAMKLPSLMKVVRRICLCHLTARRPHAALDAYVFSQRTMVTKRSRFQTMVFIGLHSGLFLAERGSARGARHPHSGTSEHDALTPLVGFSCLLGSARHFHRNSVKGKCPR